MLVAEQKSYKSCQFASPGPGVQDHKSVALKMKGIPRGK